MAQWTENGALIADNYVSPGDLSQWNWMDAFLFEVPGYAFATDYFIGITSVLVPLYVTVFVGGGGGGSKSRTARPIGIVGGFK